MSKILYEDEKWVDIPNFENRFSISNYGRVKNLKNGKIRKLTLNKNGYYIISLWDKEKKERYPLAIHRLVAKMFLNGYDECVNHIDGNKKNNFYKNLEWCSLAENTKHAYKSKLINNHCSVEIIENGFKFRTIAECVNWLRENGYPKANHGNISLNIKGARKHAYGYTYKLIDKII